MSANNKRSTILVIEDDPSIRKLHSITLENHDYKVITANDGHEGVRLVASTKPELIVLDLGLPDFDGKDVIRLIRDSSQAPIIVCTVRDSDSELIACLDEGADDYLTKPFNPDVLLARVHANLRKSVTQAAGQPELQNGDIHMDLIRHEVFFKGEKLSLTPKEYDLLRYFMINRGKMLTHPQILREVWGPAHSDDMQYLRVYISQLREKLEGPNPETTYIFTEPGIGYRMETMESATSAAHADEPEAAQAAGA